MLTWATSPVQTRQDLFEGVRIQPGNPPSMGFPINDEQGYKIDLSNVSFEKKNLKKRTGVCDGCRPPLALVKLIARGSPDIGGAVWTLESRYRGCKLAKLALGMVSAGCCLQAKWINF